MSLYTETAKMIKNTGHCFHGNHRKNRDGQKCFKQSLSSPKCWHIMKLGFILKPGYVYLEKFLNLETSQAVPGKRHVSFCFLTFQCWIQSESKIKKKNFLREFRQISQHVLDIFHIEYGKRGWKKKSVVCSFRLFELTEAVTPRCS